MPDINEKKLLKLLHQSIIERKGECSDYNFLIILFKDYLVLSQNNFLRLTELLQQLKNIESFQAKSVILHIINEINIIPLEQLTEATELSLRLKIFFQFYPEYILHLSSAHSAALAIEPAYFKFDEEVEVDTEVIIEDPDNNFLNLSRIDREVYLSGIRKDERYINLLKIIPVQERIQILTQLILNGCDSPDSAHLLSTNVLSNFFSDIPEYLLPNLLKYTLWIIENKPKYTAYSALSILGKLHKKNIPIPLSDKDIYGPCRESKILRKVRSLFYDDELSLNERISILDCILEFLPNALNMMYEVFIKDDGCVFDSHAQLFLSKITLASEQQKLALLKAIIEDLPMFKQAKTLLSSILIHCSNDTKTTFKKFLYEPIENKCTHFNTWHIGIYIPLFIINDDAKQTFEDLFQLLNNCLQNVEYISCILYYICKILNNLDDNDRLRLANFCIPLIDKFRKKWGGHSNATVILSEIKKHDKQIEENCLIATLNVLQKTAAENDAGFISQFCKYSSLLSGTINPITDADFFDQITARIYEAIKKVISSHQEFTDQAVDGKVKDCIEFEVLNQPLKILTDLNNFIEPAIFNLVGEQLYSYLNDDFDYNKIFVIDHVANNFKYFSSELRVRFFTLLMPKIFPNNGNSGMAEKYFGSNFVEAEAQAISICHKLLIAFSFEPDGSLNLKNVTTILNVLMKQQVQFLRYLNQFSEPLKNFVEKLTLLHIYSDENNQSILSRTISRYQYSRYYLFATRTILKPILSNEKADDLANIITSYLVNPEQKYFACKA
jgi:hypothetical protein